MDLVAILLPLVVIGFVGYGLYRTYAEISDYNNTPPSGDPGGSPMDTPDPLDPDKKH